MADFQKYSTGQRIAFAGLLIGFILTLGAGCTPFWKEGKITVNDLTKIRGFDVPIIGDLSLLELHGGLFIYCIDFPGDGRQCEAYDFSNSQGPDVIAVFTLAGSVVLSLICGCAACCRMCCCSGGRTICHGVMAFIAGGLGILTAVLFAVKSEDSFDMKLSLVHFNWAFFIFIAGVSITTLSSFILCCAYPDSPILAVLPPQLANPAMSVMVSHQTGTYNQLQEEHNPMSPYPPSGQFQQAPGAVHFPGNPPPNGYDVRPNIV